MAERLAELSHTTRFRLTRRIAGGGMAAIYDAIQYGAEGFEKRVAVKIIMTAGQKEDKERAEMFVREARLVSSLVHEHIAQIYSLGRVGKMYFIVMEYIDGKSLRQFIDRHRELRRDIPIDVGMFIVSRVCRALEYAHAKCDQHGNPMNIVHRDISPGNVMITYEGVVKLADFGVAKSRLLAIDQEGEVLFGKAQYMSPEQATFRRTDRRSDVFSVGLVGFELVTGRMVFGAESTTEVLKKVVDGTIPQPNELVPNMPPDVARIISKALERDPALRYQDAGQMAYELEHWMYHDRFGPTSVTLQKYLRELFPEEKGPSAASNVVDPGAKKISARGA